MPLDNLEVLHAVRPRPHDLPSSAAVTTMGRLLETRLRAPSMPPTVLLPLTLVFVILTLVRGVSWVFFQRPGTVSQLMLDNALGLEAWGVLLAVGAVAFIAAVVSDRHFFVWAGHAFLVSVYFGITITTLQAVLTYGGGYQHVVAPLGAVIWHGLLSRLMRPLPRRDGMRRAA